MKLPNRYLPPHKPTAWSAKSYKVDSRSWVRSHVRDAQRRIRGIMWALAQPVMRHREELH